MQITRTSIASGITRTKELPVTETELARWKEGELIQYAMPRLSPSEREFVMTGITDEEWDELFGEDGEMDD